MGIDLSPSRLSLFLSCGLKYKFKYIDKLGDPPGQAAVNGTAVHETFEYLYQAEEPSQRTLLSALEYLDLVVSDWPKVTAFLPDKERCQELVWNLFDLEDPTTVECLRTEMDMLLPWFDEHQLRGIMDRVDKDGGGYTIVDYKTGKAPSDHYLDEKLLGVKFYAMMGKQAFGTLPTEVKLHFLGTPQTVSVRVGEGMVRGISSVARAAVETIERGEFKAKPGDACRFCPYKEICPTPLTTSKKGRKVKP